MDMQRDQINDENNHPGACISIEPFKSSILCELDLPDLDEVSSDMAEIRDGIEYLLTRIDEQEAPMVYYLLRYALIEAQSVGLQV